MKRELVMTLAHRYSWDDLCVFVNSLRSSGYEGDIVVFASRLGGHAIREMRQRNVKVVRVHLPLVKVHNVFLLAGWKPWRLLLRAMPTLRLKRAVAMRVFNIMCARFAFYHRYLEKHAGLYDRVMIADVRDVFFQRSPFAIPLPAGIVSFQESNIIKHGKSNWRWLKEAYGEETAAGFVGKAICCAGVTLGETPSILRYLRLMLEHLFAVRLMVPVAGVDQAVHNRIFHDGLLPDSLMLANGNEHCMTMGANEPYNLDNETVSATNGTVVSILHQYDRFAELKQLMRKRAGCLDE